jgi:hypothetical protein
MSAELSASPGEFRRYRRFVSWFVLTFVSLGSAYLLVSVGVTIYRRRHAVPTGAPVGVVASASDLEGCLEELTDVEQGLERHLQNFHHLLAHYDADEAQRWSEDRSFWLGQWKAAEERCRYGDPRPGRYAKEWEALAVIHTQLHDLEATYSKELLRSVGNQAPRLNHIRDRLEAVAQRIGAGAAPTTASPDSGDSHP